MDMHAYSYMCLSMKGYKLTNHNLIIILTFIHLCMHNIVYEHVLQRAHSSSSFMFNSVAADHLLHVLAIYIDGVSRDRDASQLTQTLLHGCF
jgi:hypothetical protein